MKSSTATAVILAAVQTAAGLANGLGATPQMGWNNWNAYACDIDEASVLENAHALVDSGLSRLGYDYVVIDDCWSNLTRSADGRLQPDQNKFPRGMKAVADEIHALGLKFGMYSDAGSLTCAKYPGSLGFEEIDAQTFADWTVDYLKYDNCYNEGLAGNETVSFDRYNKMAVALNETGRPIFYSMCNWGDDASWNWFAEIANSARMSGDVYDNFDQPHHLCPCATIDCDEFQGNHCSFMNIIEKAAPIIQHTGPGGWLDLDILEIGNGGASYEEYITQFSIWSILKSPLLLGNRLKDMSKETMDIIGNEEMIAINQDPEGRPATRNWKKTLADGVSNVQLWSGPLSGGDYVVAVVNASPSVQNIVAQFQDIWPDDSSSATSSYTIRDLWLHRNLGVVASELETVVESHSTNVFRLSKQRTMKGDL